jgi:hypothetical protein
MWYCATIMHNVIDQSVRSWAASPSKRLSASLTLQQSYPSPGYVDGWKRVAQAYRSVQPGVKITFHNVFYTTRRSSTNSISTLPRPGTSGWPSMRRSRRPA